MIAPMRMLKRTTWLVGGRVVSDVLALVFYIAVARTFGQEGIGDYAFAFAVAAFFGLGIELGLPTLLTREVARRPERVDDYCGTILTLQAGLTVFLGAVAVLLCLVLEYSGALTALVLLAFGDAALRGMGRSFNAYLEGIEAMDLSSLLEVYSRLLVVGAGLALLFLGASLPVVMVAHLLGAGLYLGLSYHWVAERFEPARLSVDLELMKRTAIAALPFVMSVALWELYARIDIVMLHQWIGSSEAGVYALGVRLVTAPVALAYLVGAAMYPSLSRDAVSSSGDQRTLFLGTLRWLGVIGVAGGLVLATVGDQLVALLFEDAFEKTGGIVRWMSILFVIQFASMPYWRLLYASDHENKVVRLQGTSLVLNIALNVALIPLWGAYGALWASVASETFLVGAFHRKAAGLISASYLSRAARLATAGSAGLLVGLGTRGLLPWPVGGALALLAFTALVVGLGLVRRRDLEAMGATGIADRAMKRARWRP